MHLILILIAIIGLVWAWPIVFDDTPENIPVDSPLMTLSNVEKQYYQQVFDYTMAAVKPGESYSWSSSESSGTLTVSKEFQSKSGATCRIFNERYNINGVEGSDSGVGCRREGREGWCRLKKQDALTCALEKPGGFFDRLKRNTLDTTEEGKGIWGAIKGWWE